MKNAFYAVMMLCCVIASILYMGSNWPAAGWAGGSALWVGIAWILDTLRDV
jgi:hypothetical protein